MAFRIAAGLCVALALAGCEQVDFIELAPSTIDFKQLNNEKYVEAKCMARTGVRAVKAQVTWSSKDPAIATVTPKGLVKPVKSGTTEVIAKYGDVEARTTVNVILVERIEVEPKQVTLKEGESAFHPTVKAYAADGRLLTDRQVTLSTKDKTVAQIVGGGDILPLDPGSTTIDVQVDAVKSSLQVTVEADKAKK